MRGSHLKDLVKKEKLYKERFIDRVGWLDRITFSRLEEIKQQVELSQATLSLLNQWYNLGKN